MSKYKISIIIGCMCLLLSLGISIQIKTIKNIGTSTTSTNETENKLRDEILKTKEKYDNLYADLEEAEIKLEEERNNATNNNSDLETLKQEITEGNKILGLTEITGQGIVVILNDNQLTNNNYIFDPNSALVHDMDVIKVINELKNAGAEAISINDQRIVTNTAIECDGNVVKINGVKIGAPFEIKAIGLPEYLINVNRYGGYLMYLEQRGISVTVNKSDKITIPKYTGVIKFEYAISK